MIRTGISIDEFKLRIIRQLKDPCSALNCLLSTSNPKVNIGEGECSRTNIADMSSQFNASEFATRLNFIYSPNVTFDKNPILPYPYQKGGHNVVFEYTEDFMIDISDNKILPRFDFCEETILPSEDCSDKLVFRVRPFFIQHNNYEYFKVYSEKYQDKIVFDLSTMTFTEDRDVLDTIRKWRMFHLFGVSELHPNTGLPVHLQYMHDAEKHTTVIPLLNRSKIDDETKRKLISIITSGCKHEYPLTRLGVIARCLLDIKNKE